MTDRDELEKLIAKARSRGHSVAPLRDEEGRIFAVETNGRRQVPLTFVEWARERVV